ncbi:MAG TPA: MiaB/RimO family radical SAM methylthiotransferase, partial [bacterium]|nr:MiaB/RimO family radical SAM methylthiotransferase [bacterium]
KTYGCKANQYDSQLLVENLLDDGYEMTTFKDAGIVIVNTCCVTGKAEKEARSFIRKAAGEGKEVWVTGCAVKRDGFVEKAGVIVKVLSDIKLKKKTISHFYNHTRAFVKIEEGCENFCSYCVVPYVRGKVRSRNEDEIVEEVKTLCGNGYKEIVLTGIDTGAYGMDTGTDIIKLIERLKDVEGLKRIRLSSIEVFYLTDKLIDYLVLNELFCPHLHIPLQSGSDKILKLMGRRYTFSEYLQRIERIKKRDRYDRFTFTTDIMVGFPYEEDDDFRLSLKAVEEIGFLKVHIFRYSAREGTYAFSIGGNVSEEMKKERERELELIAGKGSIKAKKQFTGKILDVLVERQAENGWEGYSSQYIPVCISDEIERCLINEIISFVAKNIGSDGILYGEIV